MIRENTIKENINDNKVALKTKQKSVVKELLDIISLTLADSIISFLLKRDIDLIDIKVNIVALIQVLIVLFALDTVASTIGLIGGMHFWAVIISFIFVANNKVCKKFLRAGSKLVVKKHYKKYSNLYKK